MSSKKLRRLDALVDELVQDMRRRGLKSGDPYLSAVSASELLGVSRATAHRALVCLAHRQLLVRQPRSGTFIGPAFESAPAASAQTIHMLIPEDWNYLYIKEFVLGALQELPGVGVRIAAVPPPPRDEFFRELPGLAAAGDLVGFVLASCPRDVHQFFAECRWPTVLLGAPYTDDFPCPSLEQDDRGHARNLAGYLMARGHRRLGLLATSEGRPGPVRFRDALSEILAEANLPANALTARFAAMEPEVLDLQIRQLLGAHRVTGIITAKVELAQRVEQVGLSMGLERGVDFEIVTRELSAEIPGVGRYPHSRTVSGPAQIMAGAIRMLRQLAEGKKPEPFHEIIPVMMHLPHAEPGPEVTLRSG